MEGIGDASLFAAIEDMKAQLEVHNSLQNVILRDNPALRRKANKGRQTRIDR